MDPLSGVGGAGCTGTMELVYIAAEILFISVLILTTSHYHKFQNALYVGRTVTLHSLSVYISAGFCLFVCLF